MTDPTDFAVASALYEALCGITGEQNALRYSQRFLPLTAEFHAGLKNYEGMAFYAYTTALAWHEKINAELWSGHPSADVQLVRDILNQALDKLPVHKLNGGTVYRGYRAQNLEGFLGPYRPGATVHFQDSQAPRSRKTVPLEVMSCSS